MIVIAVFMCVYSILCLLALTRSFPHPSYVQIEEHLCVYAVFIVFALCLCCVYDAGVSVFMLCLLILHLVYVVFPGTRYLVPGTWYLETQHKHVYNK